MDRILGQTHDGRGFQRDQRVPEGLQIKLMFLRTDHLMKGTCSFISYNLCIKLHLEQGLVKTLKMA